MTTLQEKKVLIRNRNYFEDIAVGISELPKQNPVDGCFSPDEWAEKVGLVVEANVLLSRLNERREDGFLRA